MSEDNVTVPADDYQALLDVVRAYWRCCEPPVGCLASAVALDRAVDRTAHLVAPPKVIGMARGAHRR